MKFILVVEDTHKGIRCTAAYKPNDLLDNLEQSIAAKTVANWAQYLKDLEAQGLIYVEKE